MAKPPEHGLLLCPGSSLDLLSDHRDLFSHLEDVGLIVSCSKVFLTEWMAHWQILLNDYGSAAFCHADVTFTTFEIASKHWNELLVKPAIVYSHVNLVGLGLSLPYALKMMMAFHDSRADRPFPEDRIEPYTASPLKTIGILGADHGVRNPKTNQHYASGIHFPAPAEANTEDNCRAIDLWLQQTGIPMAKSRGIKLVNLSPWSGLPATIPKMSLKVWSKQVRES